MILQRKATVDEDNVQIWS